MIPRSWFPTLSAPSDGAATADSHANSLEPDLFRTFAPVTDKRFAQHLPALFRGRAQQAAGALPHRVATPVEARRVPARFLMDQHARSMIPGRHLAIQGKVVVPCGHST